MLKLGNKIINNLYLGDKKIAKAYLGNKLVHEPPPIFVEYLQSNGNEWIDTLVPHQNGITITATIQGLGDKGMIMSFYQDWQGSCVVDTGEAIQLSNNNRLSVSSRDVNTIINKYEGENGNRTITLQCGDEIVSLYRGDRDYEPYTCVLFMGQFWAVPESYWKGRLYSFKAELNGVLIKDLRPCLHPITLRPAMYDMVTHKYFYNQGSGEFSYPKFVEYLESTGTQWILTDFYPALDDEFVVDLQHITEYSYGGDRMFFGIQQVDNTKASVFVEQYSSTYNWYVRYGTSSSKSKASLEAERTDRFTITLNKSTFTTSFGTQITLNGNIELNETPLTVYNQVSASGANRCSKLKIWSFYVLRNGEKVLDLKPCLDADGVPCMYDIVTKKHFYNAGTGNFVVGDII